MAITSTIYWAYDSSTATLTLSNSSVSGTNSGSFAGTAHWTNENSVPWWSYENYITTVNIASTISPQYTSYWFSGIANATGINNISNLDTSLVEDMSFMFLWCDTLTSLDLSSFDTSNVRDMSSMFDTCSSLTSLDVSSFDTSNVTSMVSMFYGCEKLTSLDVSGFNTSNVMNMSSMFSGCSKLTNLDLGNFNVSNATNISYMFEYCSALVTIYANNDWNENAPTSTKMFYKCTSLVGGNGTVYNASYITATYAHPDTTSNSGYFTYRPRIYWAITNGVLTFSNATISGTYSGSFLTTTQWTTRSEVPWYSYVSTITTVNIASSISPQHTDYWFDFCTALTTFTNISNLNTSSTTSMKNMFYHCISLASIDVTGFDTSSVTTMEYMFYDCNDLTSLDVSNFDTTYVTNMQGMFYNCSDLTSLDVTNFDVGNVTNMNKMFEGCSSLTSLNIENFDTENVADMNYMFYGCSSLVTIYASSLWTVGATTTSIYMFYNCTSLVGAIAYDSSKLDATYANYTTGYFTEAIYYTVTFNLQGKGSPAPTTQSILTGTTATQPQNPIQTGYTFGGWYNEAACTTAFNFSTAIVANKTIYAKWTVTTYTITYNLDGGSVSPSNPSTYTIETSSFTLTNPTKSSYDFLGWTGTGISVMGDVITIPQGSTGNRTYTANWTLTSYDVTFNMQGHGVQIDPQSVVSGQTATQPTAPTATGYTFGGWYTEAACTNAFNFSTAITEDKVLYAKWTIISYTVTFDVQGHGTAPSSQTINYGLTATKPTNPTASGWVFINWYTESACTNVFDFSTPITQATTLYAKWVDASTVYTVTFNTHGHGTVESQLVTAGSYASVPSPEPSETGFRFTGWYTTAQCTTIFAFATTPIIGNTTIHAGWELGRVADPQRGQASTITAYKNKFSEDKITEAQALVSSTNLPLKASILNGPTNIVGTSSTNPGLQGMHKTLVTDVLERDKETWFNEDSGNEGWVYNLIHTARAAFDATKTYRKNDIVTYNNDGKTYIAKQDVETGTLPTDTTNWLALSIQGAQGNPYWGVSYKGNWDSTIAYSAKDMVRHMEGDDLSTAVFYVAMTNQSAGSPLTNWLKALEMKESKIQETESITGLTGTYYIDDGSGNITFYDAQGSTADTLYTYTVMSNVIMTTSTTSYVSNGMYMNNALSYLSSRNNLY